MFGPSYGIIVCNFVHHRFTSSSLAVPISIELTQARDDGLSLLAFRSGKGPKKLIIVGLNSLSVLGFSRFGWWVSLTP